MPSCVLRDAVFQNCGGFGGEAISGGKPAANAAPTPTVDSPLYQLDRFTCLAFAGTPTAATPSSVLAAIGSVYLFVAQSKKLVWIKGNEGTSPGRLRFHQPTRHVSQPTVCYSYEVRWLGSRAQSAGSHEQHRQ